MKIKLHHTTRNSFLLLRYIGCHDKGVKAIANLKDEDTTINDVVYSHKAVRYYLQDALNLVKRQLIPFYN